MPSHHCSRFRDLYAARRRSRSKTYRVMPSYGGYTAPGKKSESDRGSSGFWQKSCHPPARAPTSVNRRGSASEQHAALGLTGTFLVLMGIGIGILTLRFVLVLMHGRLH
jgi:hypothetical protein